MKKQIILIGALLAIVFQTNAFAEEGFVADYVRSSSGEVYKNSYGECWRSRFNETMDRLEECGYAPETLIVEKELVVAQTAATLTTTVADMISIQAALLFAFDSAVLSEDAKAVLEERISKYKGRGELTSNVSVIGHTDSTGPEAYNQTLSEKRAQAVANYLEQNTNITDKQVDVIGKGETEPKASNDTKVGRELNRRVIILLDAKVK